MSATRESKSSSERSDTEPAEDGVEPVYMLVFVEVIHIDRWPRLNKPILKGHATNCVGRAMENMGQVSGPTILKSGHQNVSGDIYTRAPGPASANEV